MELNGEVKEDTEIIADQNAEVYTVLDFADVTITLPSKILLPYLKKVEKHILERYVRICY